MVTRRLLAMLLLWLAILPASAIRAPIDEAPPAPQHFGERSYIVVVVCTSESAYPGFGYVVSGYRYYSPDTGRWLSRDPIQEEGGPNLDAFLENDPLNFIDPLGLNRFKVVCDAADDLERRINGLGNRTGEKFKGLFMELQLCILKKLCAGACCDWEEKAKWLNSVIDTFMSQFTDALDGKFYPDNSLWEPLLDRIDNLQPLAPQRGDSVMIAIGTPAGGNALYTQAGMAMTDYATGVLVSRQMALAHINQDLRQALNNHGVGTDEDWKCIGDTVGECQKGFFTKLELMFTKIFPKEWQFDIPFIRDRMRDRVKQGLSGKSI